MRRAIPLLFFTPLFMMSLLLGNPAAAQSSSALINEQLDKIYQLDTREQLPLGQVLERVTNDTGVPFDVDPAVWELLPWGEQTALKLTVANQTLRATLDGIARPLGLQVVLRGEDMQIRASPPLARLGRRATVEELGVLDLLGRTPLEPKSDRLPVRDVLAAVDAKLEAAKSPFAVENRSSEASVAAMAVPVARNATLADALEAVDAHTAATWYPWGKSVVVENKRSHMAERLRRTIDVSFAHDDVAQVLAELSRRSGVPFVIEPGALQRIPPEARRIGLVADNYSVQQLLETIAGHTGLAYMVNEKGVYVWNPSSGSELGGAGAPRERMFGLMQLDNGMQVLIPQSQVPEDLREYLQHKVAREFEKVRQQMNEEGFRPTTRPAAPTTAASEDL